MIAVRRNVRVSDPAAHAFTRAFYLALAVGDTVVNAYEIAKQVIESIRVYTYHPDL